MRRLGFVLASVLLLGGLSAPTFATSGPSPLPTQTTLPLAGPAFVNYGPRGGVRILPTHTSAPHSYARTAARTSTTPTSAFTNATSQACTSGLPVNICVHYQASGNLSGSASVASASFVSSVLSAFQTSETKYLQSGYKPIQADPATPGVMNVYLEDLATWQGGQFKGAFGLTAPASNTGVNGGDDRPAFMVLDNDFACSQYGDACNNPYSPTQIMDVTVAHEFFHATQFAYDASADGWFMEATATWAETQVFPSLTDNRNYLYDRSVGVIGAPNQPLDDSNALSSNDPIAPYQDFLFFQFLGEKYPAMTGAMPTVVLNSWRYSDTAAGAASYTGITAVAHELARQKSSLNAAWRNFVMANRAPSQNYKQGSHYPGARLAWAKTITPSSLGQVALTRYVPHLAAQTMQLVPSSLPSNQGVHLAFRISDPHAGFIGIQVKRRDGAIQVYRLTPDVSGAVSINLGFGSAAVSSIEIAFANAGAIFYGCESQDEGYTCHGLPKIGNVGFTWTASFYRS